MFFQQSFSCNKIRNTCSIKFISILVSYGVDEKLNDFKNIFKKHRKKQLYINVHCYFDNFSSVKC